MERFSTKYTVDERTGCWNWTAYRDGRGYGLFRMPTGTAWAHRAAYELLIAPIPAGLEIDHRCRNRSCVNPAHLEPVTPQVNTDRSSHAKRMFCVTAGHPMAGDNIGKRSDGRRYCVACHRAKAQAARKAAANEAQAARLERWQAFCETAGLDPQTGQELAS